MCERGARTRIRARLLFAAVVIVSAACGSASAGPTGSLSGGAPVASATAAGSAFEVTGTIVSIDGDRSFAVRAVATTPEMSNWRRKVPTAVQTVADTQYRIAGRDAASIHTLAEAAVAPGDHVQLVFRQEFASATDHAQGYTLVLRELRAGPEVSIPWPLYPVCSDGRPQSEIVATGRFPLEPTSPDISCVQNSISPAGSSAWDGFYLLTDGRGLHLYERLSALPLKPGRIPSETGTLVIGGATWNWGQYDAGMILSGSLGPAAYVEFDLPSHEHAADLYLLHQLVLSLDPTR
ncbi:MAG: hypothetical protein M3O91_05150 [Chloroflexota bacterium]|nr:hypothetical protein [Chloroflexota bacterium]